MVDMQHVACVNEVRAEAGVAGTFLMGGGVLQKKSCYEDKDNQNCPQGADPIPKVKFKCEIANMVACFTLHASHDEGRGVKPQKFLSFSISNCM